jgi:hypothetical protein
MRGKILSLPLFARRFPLKHAFGMAAAPPRPNRKSFSSTSIKELGDKMAQASEQQPQDKKGCKMKKVRGGEGCDTVRSGDKRVGMQG